MAVGLLAAALFGASPRAGAEEPSPPRIVVTGEGSVMAAPDYAEIRGGVTARGKTAEEAMEANTKAMNGLMTALADSGVAQNDMQTAQFSVQPVYAAPQPGAAEKLTGFAVANEVEVKIRQIGKLGDILDRLVSAGATDIGNIAFRHDDDAKLRDQARSAAVADARRKAELYAKSASVKLGRIAFITEDAGYVSPMPMMRAAMPAAVPIAPGEDSLQVRITVGFDIAP